jgi:hypothetical protein
MRSTIRSAILVPACLAAALMAILTPAAQAIGHKHHGAHAARAVPTLAQCQSLEAEMAQAAQSALRGQDPRTAHVPATVKAQLARFQAGYEACFEAYGYEIVVTPIGPGHRSGPASSGVSKPAANELTAVRIS